MPCITIYVPPKEYETYLRFKRRLEVEGISFSRWIRQGIRKREAQAQLSQEKREKKEAARKAAEVPVVEEKPW